MCADNCKHICKESSLCLHEFLEAIYENILSQILVYQWIGGNNSVHSHSFYFSKLKSTNLQTELHENTDANTLEIFS